MTSTYINGNVLRNMQYFSTHWPPNAELQHFVITQLTILNVTHFQLEFQIIEFPIIKYSKNHYLLKAGWN
jgi:hypothetical protein